jgi:hypothetical protein
MSFPDIRIGIEPKPLRRDELPLDATKMRAAISEARHESHIISNIMYMADVQGLSAEDRYTTLAYHALVALQTYYARCLEITRLYPSPSVILGSASIKADGE